MDFFDFKAYFIACMSFIMDTHNGVSPVVEQEENEFMLTL